MPGTVITTSTNIAVLDSKIISDLCQGKFYVDISPSIYIGSGASNVLGAKVQIINPYGVIIKSYGSSYDIAPSLSGGMSGVVAINIPTQAGKYQYGLYTFSVELTDADGTKYYVTKTRNICAQPDDVNGCTSAVELVASCINGTLTILVAEPPVYQGKLSESKTQTWTVYYPTASGLTSFTTTISNFSVRLFEGVYRVVGSVCATYNFGDNIYIKVGFAGDFEKNVKCILDYTCIFPRLQQLGKRLNEDCSDADKLNDESLVLNALWLIKKAELALAAGEDASEDITELEDLLGCKCTCECSASSPIINNSPSTNFQIEGCNVVKTTVGLTDHYQIENYEFLVAVDPTQNILTVSAPALNECTKTQTLSFSIINAYIGIKNQINNISEYSYWASIINKVLDPISGICLGVTNEQWATLTFAQRFSLLVSNICACCSCVASVTDSEAEQDGADVLLSWTQSGAFSVEIYVDGILVGTQLAANDSITLNGYSDGQTHNYVLIPICSNGARGTVLTGNFAFIACPSISPPVVSTNNANDVTCPFDLTSLLTPPPVGITVEWHTANNTNAGTLVPDPTAVSSGVFYAFAKDTNGCYSTSTTVTVICESETSCTAPQSLVVTAAVGGFLVQFQSATNPPPANSYTVKRRLASDPDVSGSYTTIGTPTFNSGTNRWEILDGTAANNTLYVYRAISNCSSSTPSVDYQFANISCPELSLTSTSDTIDYSFAPVGGGVDKYEVRLYDNSGISLLHTDTYLPSFSNPITGTFLYLNPSTFYKVGVRIFIGSYYKDCPLESVLTESESVVAGRGIIMQNAATATLSLIVAVETDTNPVNYVSGTHFVITGGDPPQIADSVVTGSVSFSVTIDDSGGHHLSVIGSDGVIQTQITTPGVNAYLFSGTIVNSTAMWQVIYED